MYKMTDGKIYELRKLIVELMRNSEYMFDETVRGNVYGADIDLMELIAYLYEIINQTHFNEEYHYMFHWANKVGCWVEEDNIDQLIIDRMNNKEVEE